MKGAPVAKIVILGQEGALSSLKNGEAWRGGLGGEVCDSCQCSHMSNTPMHDVHMLKVLVWTQ